GYLRLRQCGRVREVHALEGITALRQPNAALAEVGGRAAQRSGAPGLFAVRPSTRIGKAAVPPRMHYHTGMTSRTLAALPLVLLLAACAPGRAATAPSPAASPGWDFRVVQPASDAESSLQDILARAGESDVVFFGEMHDDPETHRAEAELLEAIGRLGRPVVLSLEMFERDVQQAVDDYLAGRLSETAFLEVTRPWPRYATDYRPLVETAKANGWP